MLRNCRFGISSTISHTAWLLLSIARICDSLSLSLVLQPYDNAKGRCGFLEYLVRIEIATVEKQFGIFSGEAPGDRVRVGYVECIIAGE